MKLNLEEIAEKIRRFDVVYEARIISKGINGLMWIEALSTPMERCKGNHIGGQVSCESLRKTIWHFQIPHSEQYYMRHGRV
ncbi:MAG: hypothetical protein J7J22_05080 [Candidatus Verstraetearchaeota archaeon]|nr:hypothetical protein [Candidatus Verstraetearchaeota archaeon]